MPDVLFDDKFRSRASNTQGYTGASGPFYTSGQRAIAIYKAGTLPANLDHIAVYNNVPGAYIPDTNLLLHLTSWGGVTISIAAAATVGNYGLVELTTSAALALETGTAAEFLYYQVNSPINLGTVHGAISGSVTVSGGGGDLVIDNVNLVQGASYSVSQWRHKVFQDFTY